MTTNPAIIAELKRIASAHAGELQPAVVVEAARDEESPLHAQFDWNDTTAAAKHRLWQARSLIRVVVTYESVGDGKLVPCRVFVSLTPDRENESGYRVTSAVLANPDQRRQMLADARAEMGRFRVKYQHLSELARVFEAMDDVAEPATDFASATA